MRSVEVSPAIRELVPAQELNEFVASLAETELRCISCGTEIPAGSGDPVAVQLLRDPTDHFDMLSPSHVSCGGSGVHEIEGLAQELNDRSGEDDVRWCPMILPSGEVAVAWEASRRIVGWDDYERDAVTLAVSGYLNFGFDLVAPSLIKTDALPSLPRLRRWTGTLTGDGVLTIRAPNKQIALEAELSSEAVPLVRAGLAQSDWLVALTGVGLHLDSEHDREAGLAYAATQGKLVGARIRISVEPEGQS